MSELPTIRIEVDLSTDETHLDVKSVSTLNLEVAASFKVDHRSGIKVSAGIWQIDFHQPEEATWKFLDFKLVNPPDGSQAPIVLKVVKDHFMRIEDSNVGGSAGGSFTYQIEVETSDGRKKWIDPVIENESGG